MNYNILRPLNMLKFLSIFLLNTIVVCNFQRAATAQCMPAASGVSVSYSITNLSCNGDGSGSVSIIVTGGGAPYSFTIGGGNIAFQSISKATNTHTFTGLPADPNFLINVQAKIAVGFAVCTFNNLTITEPDLITSSTSIITDVSCNGGSNGAIDLTLAGGTAPYTYAWSNGAGTEDISGLTAGGYSVTVTDAGTCPQTFNFTVNEPAPIVSTATSLDATCNGGSDGSITLTTVSGGTAPYTFTWSNGSTTQDISGLSAGPYSVTITDANLCPQVFNFNINEPTPITSTSTIIDVACNGGADGSITLTIVAGGVAPYSFVWSNGAATQNISGLSAGPYSVTIRDASLCSQIFNFNINEPIPIATSSSVVDAICNGGATGSITLNTVTGGTAPYTFIWSNGATTKDISGLIAGAYSVTVTDAASCPPQVFNFTVNEPSLIATTSTVVDATCSGGPTGSITLNTVTGGIAPYTFVWSNGASSQDISGLTAGSYSVTVTDANLCPQIFNFNINEPAPIATTSTVVDETCNGGATGSITLNTVTGGNAPYSFVWSNGATSQDISGLTAGSYFVTITDASLCFQIFNFNITEPNPIAITSTVVDITCSGGGNGSITLNTVTGGTAPYTYAWSNGAATQNISGLSSGPYSVTVTDANLCPQVFNFNINEPTPISTTSVVVDATCNGGSNGSITLTTVTGGIAPYTFAWSNGTTTQDISGLIAGTYSVTVTDANLCPQVFNFNVNEPTPIATTSTVVDATCNGGATGSITLNTVTGGTAPYTFVWSNGATTQDISGLTAGSYSVTVTDANLCPQVFNFNVNEPIPIAITSTTVDVACNGGTNGSITINSIANGTAPYTFVWSNGATTQDISGIVAGPYSVTITDANLCSQLFNFNITAPTPIITISTVVDATCNGGATGSITLPTVTGGTAPYTFAWSNSATTQDISGLTAGPYSVTVTDANLCLQVFNFNINEPTPIATTSTVVDATCNGGATGSITLTTVTGGIAPYTFAWSNGATTQDISGLTAGSYSVTVTDANLCPQVFNFNVNEPTPIATTSTVVDATCNGGATGSVTLNTVTGGAAPYAFVWSNGANTQDISGLIAGPYFVTITDANLCSQIFNFNVNEPTPIIITSNTINTSTCGGNDGSIDITAISGGTAPYSVLWNTGAITQNITGLSAGSYSVTITDALTCPQVFNFSVSDPTTFTVTPTVTNVSCNGANDGSIMHAIVGGTAPFTILWNTGDITQDLAGLSGGNYTVSIVDATNCTYNGNYTINEPSAILITSSTADITTCGGSDGSITLNSVSGGVGTYTYLWNTGAITQNLTGLAAGSYSVTITDATSCARVFNFSLSDPIPFTVSSVVVDVTCNGTNNGSITHTITGGTAPFSILWNTGASTQDLSGLAGGTYTVTITDASGCTFNGNYTINEPAVISIVSAITNITTCGGNDGAIDLTTITGGTAPYTFAWNTGAATQNISGLNAGAYNVIVTDFNSCTLGPIAFNLTDPITFTVTPAITDITCNGSANGAIDLTLVGGALPISYTWSNGAITEDIAGLAQGSYNVTVVDGGGCTFNGSYTVNEPSAIVVTSSITDVTCNGGINGAITLTSVTGGVTPYTYLWNTGAGTLNITGLTAGSYSVSVSDANGCPKNLNFTVNEPSPMTDVSSITNTSTCGNNDGAINITSILGGTAPFTYLWSTGAMTPNLSGLSAGMYFVNVTDANGCTQAFNYSVSDPIVFNVNPTIVNASCNSTTDGSISLVITGGVAPLTILWNTGDVTANISNLVAGTYFVNITDASGCSFSQSYTISEPSAIAITSAVLNTSNCSATDGSITLSTVSGGVAPYSFLWNTGAVSQSLSGLSSGTYNVIITDASNCTQSFGFAISNPTPFTVVPSVVNVPCNNTGGGAISLAISGETAPLTILWNTGATTASITNLSAGIYNVSITDASSCTFNASYTLVEPSAIDTLSIVTTLSHVVCPGSNEGSVTLSNITGGTPAYTYVLGGNSSFTPTFNTLIAGSYTMNIKDANGCNFYHSFIINEPNPIAYSISTTVAMCKNDDASLNFGPVTGGTPPYLYSIDGGTTFTNQVSYTSLAPKVYSVFVQDANMCTYGYLVPVIRKQGPTPYIRTRSTSCFQGFDGAIIIDSLQSGVSPFNFYINGQNRGSSKVFVDLSSGNYSIMIEDQDCVYDINYYYLYNGLNYDTIKVKEINVPQPAPVTAEVEAIDTDKKNSNGVAIVYNFTGGTSPYQYSLDATYGYASVLNDSVSIGGLNIGTYKVFLLDTNGCKGEVSIRIAVDFFIPNLITPNGDGKNDYFEILGLPRRSKLTIYNNWNERIFYSTNYDNSWGGKEVSNGVYYYELILPNGNSHKGWLQIVD